MIDLTKSYDFFQPESVHERIHIVGCGSVGATLAENLVRLGLTKITLYDFDKVSPHNLANQIFRQQDIGAPKVDALKDILLDINPDVERDLKIKPDGWHGEKMSGFIFLAVDDIDLRRQIVEQHMNSAFVRGIFDWRTLLTGAQHYAADWNSPLDKKALLNSMAFSHEEAAAETPVSACGVTLGVAPTVRAICAIGIANFLNFVKGNGLKKLVLFDVFDFTLEAY